MDLGCLNLDGSFDRDVHGLVGAEPDNQIALYGVALGHPREVDRVRGRRTH
jgi:hypothetical protein